MNISIKNNRQKIDLLPGALCPTSERICKKFKFIHELYFKGNKIYNFPQRGWRLL